MAKEKVKKPKGPSKDPVVDEENLPVVSIDECEEFDPSFKNDNKQDADEEDTFEELDDDIEE